MAKMQSRYNRIDVAHEKCNQCKVEIFEKSYPYGNGSGIWFASNLQNGIKLLTYIFIFVIYVLHVHMDICAGQDASMSGRNSRELWKLGIFLKIYP